MKFASAGFHACSISRPCRLLSAEAGIQYHTELRMKAIFLLSFVIFAG